MRPTPTGDPKPGSASTVYTVTRPVRTPKAWHNLLRVQFETVPAAVYRSRKARRAMNGLGRIPGRKVR